MYGGISMRKKAALTVILSLITSNVWAHGFVGQRFFPATITVDDPVPGDEFNISTFDTQSPGDDGGSVWTLNPVVTWNKRITPYLQAGITASYLNIRNPNGVRPQNGFDNWAVSVLYEAFESPHYESVFSIGLDVDIGGTGSHIVDADSFTTYSPGIFFGQGFGALPSSLKYLRPFAITGTVAPGISTGHYQVTVVNYGLTIMYSLPYLQAFVDSTQYPNFMNHFIPVIELPVSTCTQGDCSGQTTGTINPGVISVWKSGQVSFEALIPMNRRTGSKVGGVLQLHFYLDDIFPNSFLGKPIFA